MVASGFAVLSGALLLGCPNKSGLPDGFSRHSLLFADKLIDEAAAEVSGRNGLFDEKDILLSA